MRTRNGRATTSCRQLLVRSTITARGALVFAALVFAALVFAALVFAGGTRRALAMGVPSAGIRQEQPK